MRHIDFSPLYRSTVGFDRLFSLLDNMGQPEQSAPAYPPYNIERTGENAYRISMAVAGFGEDDLDIEAKENALLVKGSQQRDEDDGKDMLHRGIAARNFERRFQLADHVEVRDAHLLHGLLHIDLVRTIPEAMKSRKIAVKSGKDDARRIEAKPAKSTTKSAA
ncbi:Hsp20 family protein [Rhizobiaceae bacterium]|nr:Hsp20 family protein [Rhizobiaceae bacterium]